ncbi:hypothetical protein HYW55_05540 [Candidatus Gottesmanbacteria bacterium]|nr:hypothetical protein [Candidatus Gottesmanbacteria bacterium]
MKIPKQNLGVTNIALLILVLVFFLGVIGMILWFLQPEEDRERELSALFGNSSQSQSKEDTDSDSSSTSCNPADLSCDAWVITYGLPYCLKLSEGDNSTKIDSYAIKFLKGKPIDVSATIIYDEKVRFTGEYDGKHLNLFDNDYRKGRKVDISADLSSDYQTMNGTYYVKFLENEWRGCDGGRESTGPFRGKRCQIESCQAE